MENLTNDQMRDLFEFGYQKVPIERVMQLKAKAINDLKRIVPRYSKPLLGYSAGKDSIAVKHLLEEAGLEMDSALWRTRYHYPRTLEWVEQNKPKGLKMILIERPTWDDLENIDGLLFIKEKKLDNTWMGFKWKSQKDFIRKNGYDLFVTGRRIEERNNCGSKASCYIRKAKDYDTFSPIAEWSLEETLAYLRYNGVEIPPCYTEFSNGFLYGSAAWAENPTYGKYASSENERWQEVFDTDPSVVYEAAEHLTSAKEFLKWKQSQ